MYEAAYKGSVKFFNSELFYKLFYEIYTRVVNSSLEVNATKFISVDNYFRTVKEMYEYVEPFIKADLTDDFRSVKNLLIKVYQLELSTNKAGKIESYKILGRECIPNIDRLKKEIAMECRKRNLTMPINMYDPGKAIMQMDE